MCTPHIHARTHTHALTHAHTHTHIQTHTPHKHTHTHTGTYANTLTQIFFSLTNHIKHSVNIPIKQTFLNIEMLNCNIIN